MFVGLSQFRRYGQGGLRSSVGTTHIPAKHHLDLTAGPGHYLEVRSNINADREETAVSVPKGPSGWGVNRSLAESDQKVNLIDTVLTKEVLPMPAERLLSACYQTLGAGFGHGFLSCRGVQLGQHRRHVILHGSG